MSTQFLDEINENYQHFHVISVLLLSLAVWLMMVLCPILDPFHKILKISFRVGSKAEGLP